MLRALLSGRLRRQAPAQLPQQGRKQGLWPRHAGPPGVPSGLWPGDARGKPRASGARCGHSGLSRTPASCHRKDAGRHTPALMRCEKNLL